MKVHRLNAAVLVASLKDETCLVVVGHMVVRHHHGGGEHGHVVAARVLGDDCGEFAVGVGNHARAVEHVHGELLVRVVVVHVGARGHLAAHVHRVLAHHEACREQHGVGVVLLIDAKHIVATFCQLEILVGNREIVVEIVCKRGFALLVVVDVGLVKSLHILALDQHRGAPQGVAMRHAVAQVVHVVVQQVEIHVDAVVAIHHYHRWRIHVAHGRHLEAVHAAVHHLHLRVGGTQLCPGHQRGRCHGKKHKRASHHHSRHYFFILCDHSCPPKV